MAWWLQFAELVYKLSLPLGGAIGLYLAWQRVAAANRQAEAQIRQAEASARKTDLDRRKQAADLFNQAVNQLRDERLEVRLVAIYTLRQMLEDYPDEAKAIVPLLANFIRENPRPWGDGEPPADVKEIAQILVAALGGNP